MAEDRDQWRGLVSIVLKAWKALKLFLYDIYRVLQQNTDIREHSMRQIL
jgi:hypothetical protein